MKRQDGYYIETREIAFGRMLWCVLKKWRAILCIAVVCAILAGAYRFQSDFRMHKAAYEAALNTVEVETVSLEELQNQLNEDQLSGIQRALYFQKRATVTSEYLDHSILLHADPYAKDVNYIYYSPISGEMKPVAVKLEKYIFDNDFFQNLIDELQWDTSTQHMWELFDYEFDDSRIKITVAADTTANSKALAEATMELIQQEFSGIVDEGYAVADCVVDYSLVTRYNDIYQYYVSSTENYLNYRYHFNETQIRVLDMLLAEGQEVAIEEQPYIEPVLEPTFVNKKMIIMGGLAGLVIGIVWFAILFTFSANIHGEDEISHLFAEQIVGLVNVQHFGKKRWFAIVDRLLDRIGNRGSKALNYGQQLRMLASNLYLKCQQENVHNIFVTGSKMACIPKEFLEELSQLLKEFGITVTVGGSILSDSKALLDAAKIGCVAIIEIDEYSKCEEIANELNLCMIHKLPQIGIALIQR